MKCEQVKEFIDLYVGDACDELTKQKIVEHFKTCSSCDNQKIKSEKIAKIMEDDLHRLFEADPALVIEEERYVNLMEEQLLVKMVKEYQQKKHKSKLKFISLSAVAALLLFTLVFIVKGSSSIGKIGDRIIAAGEKIRTNDAVKASLNGAEVNIKPDTQITFVSSNELELDEGSVEINIYKTMDFVVRTAMGKVRAKGTRFEVKIAVIMFVYVTSGAVEVSTDQGDMVVLANETAIVEGKLPPRKVEDIGKLKEKYPDIFKKIESEYELDRSMALASLAKNSKLAKDEKQQIFLWAINRLNLSPSSVIEAVRGLGQIKASGKEVENVVKVLIKDKSRFVSVAAISLASELGLDGLKEEIFEVFKKEADNKSSKFSLYIFHSLSKFGLTKSDFSRIVDIDYSRLYEYVQNIDPVKNDHLKDVFGKMLDDSNPDVIAAGVMGVQQLKATSYKKKLMELLQSKGDLRFGANKWGNMAQILSYAVKNMITADDVKDVVSMLESSSSRVKTYVLMAMSEIKSKETEEHIAKLLEDKSDAVFLSAFEVLGKAKANKYSEKVLEQIRKRNFDRQWGLRYDIRSEFSAAFRSLFEKDNEKDLIEIYKSVPIDNDMIFNPVIHSVLELFVKWQTKEIAPFVIKQFKHLAENDIHVSNLYSEAISKLGNSADHLEDIRKILDSGHYEARISAIRILKEWKAKDCADDIVKLLKDEYYCLQALTFLIELDCLNKDLEDKAVLGLKSYFDKPVYPMNIPQFIECLAKNSKYAELFSDVILKWFEKKSSPDTINSISPELLRKIFSKAQQEKLDEILLKYIEKHPSLVRFIDYKVYKKQVLKAIIGFLDKDNDAPPIYPHIKYSLLSLNPDVKDLLLEKIELKDLDDRKLAVTDLLNLLAELSFKVEYKGDKKNMSFFSDKSGPSTVEMYYVKKDPKVATVLSQLMSLKNDIFMIVEKNRNILVFDQIKQVKEYFQKQVDELSN